MSTQSAQRYRWFLNGSNSWTTRPKGNSAVTGSIAYDGTNFNLTTSDAGVTAVPYKTLKLAKSAFRQYMHSIP